MRGSQIGRLLTSRSTTWQGLHVQPTTKKEGEKKMKMIDQMVRDEVYCCASSLVSEIAREKFDDWHHLFGDAENDREVFEHWIVSDWFAYQLEKSGEVIERDFYNLTIWGRTTTGQAISMDCVIASIYEEMAAPIDAAA